MDPGIRHSRFESHLPLLAALAQPWVQYLTSLRRWALFCFRHGPESLRVHSNGELLLSLLLSAR